MRLAGFDPDVAVADVGARVAVVLQADRAGRRTFGRTAAGGSVISTLLCTITPFQITVARAFSVLVEPL